jgi:hypothetical protein
MNPLITQYSVGHRSNDAGPQSRGEGVALPLGAPFRDAGTGRIGQVRNLVARHSHPKQE